MENKDLPSCNKSDFDQFEEARVTIKNGEPDKMVDLLGKMMQQNAISLDIIQKQQTTARRFIETGEQYKHFFDFGSEKNK